MKVFICSSKEKLLPSLTLLFILLYHFQSMYIAQERAWSRNKSLPNETRCDDGSDISPFRASTSLFISDN